MKKSKGFTLVELMIVVVVIAILASIAIPSYREYVIRGHRRAAQSEMAAIATRELQYFASERAFFNKTEFEALGYVLPPEIAEYYTYTITTSLSGSVPSFTINFTAIDSQARDGNLSLDSEGVKTPPEKW